MHRDLRAMTLGDLVAARPEAARVLDRFGLDYCCHGGRTLEDACAAAGVDAQVVDAAMPEADDGPAASWTDLDPAALADDILATHHAYLHEELPLLEALAAKVVTVHGERHPELHEVQRLLVAVRDDLEPHLAKEERVLFPAVHALAAGRRDFPFGSVENPIRMMDVEHDRAGGLLAELRAATHDYLVPDDACASYRSLYERLAELEHDTHVHIHKENHVLFPATIVLART
jgi:regulator of cell morphogenesis and NO signaling